MKSLIIFASCVLGASSVAWAQQPGSTATPVPAPAAKRQQQEATPEQPRRHSNRAAKRQQLNQSPMPSVNQKQGQTDGNRSTLNSQRSTSNAQLKQNRPSYIEALRRYKHERHDRNWWKQHFTIIVLVRGGYYYWDAGYWCPAWGYDPAYQYYDYDGPIYTYGNLLPDQVIANVQRALKELGYYAGAISGALSQATRAAITAFQEDNGLEATGAIDADTVAALGLE